MAPLRTQILGFLLLFLMGGCGPTVTFDEPQPEGVDVLHKFPKRIQGSYVNQDASSNFTVHLTIQEELILRTYDLEIWASLKALDSNYRLEGGHIISLDETENYPAQIVNDSVLIKEHNVDTTFRISETNVLKKFKGYYFLNKNSYATSWSVTKISLSKGVLTLGRISTEEEIDKLREVTETTSDTASFTFKPTQKQFKQFIKQDGFDEEEVFVRIKK